jgi:hypothetical protein
MMRVALAAAVIVMMTAGCAQYGSRAHDSRGLSWTNSQQPIEPEALRPSGRPTNNELEVLLPKANGPIGGVVVRTEGGKELLLNKAYAGAKIDGPGMVQPVTYDADRAKRDSSPAMTALPGRRELPAVLS